MKQTRVIRISDNDKDVFYMVHFLNEYALMRSTALSRGTLAKIQFEMLPLN